MARPIVWLLLAACTRPVPPPVAERDLDVDRATSPRDAASSGDAGSLDVVAAPSVELTANAPVRARPSATSARIGIIGKGARAKAVQVAPPADGCTRRWIEIAPRGWICEANVAIATASPTEAETIGLDDTGDPELGRYATVHGDAAWLYDDLADAEQNGGHAPYGAMQVRRVGEHTVRGLRYAVLSDGSLIEPWALAPVTPSTFSGVALADGKLDVAWARRATVVRTGAGTGARVATLAPRARISIREATGRHVRIDGGWVARADLRIPIAVDTLPPGVAADEHWFDVDLGQQLLVAYEGLRPVYATLVSTGRRAHPTAPALARVVRKLRTTTMTSSPSRASQAIDDEAYSVADVPWTMFYEHALALHGAYWHDAFGTVHSHGCVNLAPRDARVLYHWASPDVPPGWIAVYTLGSTVRIH